MRSQFIGKFGFHLVDNGNQGILSYEQAGELHDGLFERMTLVTGQRAWVTGGQGEQLGQRDAGGVGSSREPVRSEPCWPGFGSIISPTWDPEINLNGVTLSIAGCLKTFPYLDSQ